MSLGFGTIGEFAIGQAANVTPETITVDKWFAPLSEPIVKTKLGLRPAQQQALIAPTFPVDPQPVPFGWFWPLSEPPALKYPRRVNPAAMPFFAFYPTPQVSFSWFAPLSEPIVKAKPGLKPSLQQSVAWPPQRLTLPTIFGTLAVIETGDVGVFGIRVTNAVATAEVGVSEISPTQSPVGLVETGTQFSAAAIVETSTQTSAVAMTVPSAIRANVGIIEVKN